MTLNIGVEESCGSFECARPSIITDKKCNPFIVSDRNENDTIQSFFKQSSKWIENAFAIRQKSGQYDASRLYMPHIECLNQTLYVSCKFGTKEYGNMLGQGLWRVNINNFSIDKFHFVTPSEIHKGNANVCVDKYDTTHVYMAGTEGRVAFYENTMLKNTVKYQLKLGKSGEKVRALISNYDGRNVLHMVSGGYSAQSSSYINNTMSNYMVWADYKSYPEMGSDMEHPSIGIDLQNPLIAYLGAQYKGIAINVYDGNKMLYKGTELKIIDSKGSMGGVDRFGPQWTPSKQGGAYLTYVAGDKRIKIVYVSQKGEVGEIKDICVGKSPSMATDKKGNIHIVYNNSGTKYRKIEVIND